MHAAANAEGSGMSKRVEFERKLAEIKIAMLEAVDLAKEARLEVDENAPFALRNIEFLENFYRKSYGNAFYQFVFDKGGCGIDFMIEHGAMLRQKNVRTP
jgi:hypothetical protein